MRKGMLAMVTGIIVLAGCASDPIWWTKPDMTHFDQDHYECERDANQAVAVSLYRSCMQARGYVETTPPKR